jgi:hypothetical protein
MYGPRDAPEPIEKIRKAQWTVENTRATQVVVDRLIIHAAALRNLGLNDAVVQCAIHRFAALDPKVKARTEPAP